MFHLLTCCAHLGKKGPRYAQLGTMEDDLDDDDDDDDDEEQSSRARRQKKKKKKKKEERSIRRTRDIELVNR